MFFGSDFTDVVFKGDSISLLSKNIGATIIDRSGYSHRIRFFQTATYTDSIVQLALRTSKTVNIDNRGVLWLGSKEKSGLVKNYPDGRWRYFNYSNSMLCGHDNGGDYTFIDVTDIVSDSSGNMWVTQHNPANHYPILVFGSDNLDGDPIWKINSFSSPLDNIAKVKCLDVRGTRFWGGTEDGKVFGVNFRENLLDSLRYTWYYYRDDEIPGTEINDIAIDSKQHVWVAASGGLSRIEPEYDLVVEVILPDYLSSEIRAVAIDKWDNVWLATSDGGAVISSYSKAFTVFKTILNPKASPEERSDILSDNLYSVNIDPATQDVWFCGEGGVSVLKRQTDNGDGSDIDVKAYPNPVSFRMGEKLTLAGLPIEPITAFYDGAGQLIFSLGPEAVDYAGRIIWNGKNSKGKEIASGIYHFVVTGSGQTGKGVFIVK